jgi:hypothetical protein
MFCRSCGWNCTHSSGFHAAFSSNPSSFPSALPATHPYNQQIAKEQRQNLPAPPPTIPSAANPSTGPNTLGMVSIDKAKLLDVCEHHERMVADPTVAALLSDLKKMLN